MLVEIGMLKIVEMHEVAEIVLSNVKRVLGIDHRKNLVCMSITTGDQACQN